MKPKRIALVGCGGLGHEIAAGIKAGQAGNYTLCGIYTDQPKLTAACSETFGCAAYLTSKMMFLDKPDLMIEAAGAAALKELLEPAVKNQVDVIPLSVGVFSHRAYMDHIRQRAETHGTHVYLPSGAVGGFDLMEAAALDRELSVSIHTEKPPQALADAPCLAGRILPDHETQLVFSGNAVEAIEVFPQNVNVAVAVGLATVGADNLSVTVAANPDLHSNRHTIDLKGEFGHARIQISAAPSSNVHSSKLAAHSVISLLKRLDSWICFM